MLVWAFHLFRPSGFQATHSVGPPRSDAQAHSPLFPAHIAQHAGKGKDRAGLQMPMGKHSYPSTTTNDPVARAKPSHCCRARRSVRPQFSTTSAQSAQNSEAPNRPAARPRGGSRTPDTDRSHARTYPYYCREPETADDSTTPAITHSPRRRPARERACMHRSNRLDSTARRASSSSRQHSAAARNSSSGSTKGDAARACMVRAPASS